MPIGLPPHSAILRFMIQHCRAIWVAFFSASLTLLAICVQVFYVFKIPWLGYTLMGLSVFAFLMSMGFMVIDNVQTRNKERADREKEGNEKDQERRQIGVREQLGVFIDEGNAIGYDQQSQESFTWATRVEAYLGLNLSSDYKARFHSETYSDNEPCGTPNAFLQSRILRLTDFLKELASKEPGGRSNGKT